MSLIDSGISLSGTTVVLVGAFLVCVLGNALGSIKVRGISLGTAGVFLVALLFGYLCTLLGLKDIPFLSKFYIDGASSELISSFKFIESVGLVLFVTAVGFIAGPSFFRNLKKNAKSYVPMGALIIVIASLLTAGFAMIPGIGADFSNGVLSGALTSTPAFSAAKQVASSEGLVSLGHAIAYPFGVVGVVLFVQIVPKLLKSDIAKEREAIKIVKVEDAVIEKARREHKIIDGFGLAAFGFAVVFGLVLGGIRIPLTGAGYEGACFSLGNTGGPLIMALILGHFGHLGNRISLRVPDATLKVFREFGLVLFLFGAGVVGGVDMVSQIQASEFGAMLVLYGFLAGVVMTVIPMLIAYLFARRVCKLQLFNNLGSITGGMTSTPALGTLIGVAGTDDVASAYAATYPVALVLIVIASNLIGTFLA